MLFLFRVCLCHTVLSITCSLVVTCWGKDWLLGSLVRDVLLCLCQFPIWCPGSGLVHECVDS